MIPTPETPLTPAAACRICGAPIIAKRSTKRFCSNVHRQQYFRDQRARRNAKRNGKALTVIVPKGRLADRGHDCYQTPPAAVHALLAHETIPGAVWEPACGPGAITRVLRAAGHHVVATDLVDYDSPDQDAAGVDFLLQQRTPPGVECIVTNPPYKLAGEFAAHALRLCPRVYMLLRLICYQGARPRRARFRSARPRAADHRALAHDAPRGLDGPGSRIAARRSLGSFGTGTTRAPQW